MKTDKEMAHEYLLAMLNNTNHRHTFDDLVLHSWWMVGAMNAEADKRENEKAIKEAESHKEFMNNLSGQISCRSCGALVKLTDRSQNDECCPNCNVEIEL